jgi:predicted MFS family arabinose efflux permease
MLSMPTVTPRSIADWLSCRAVFLATYGLAAVAWISLAVLPLPESDSNTHTTHTHPVIRQPTEGSLIRVFPRRWR